MNNDNSRATMKFRRQTKLKEGIRQKKVWTFCITVIYYSVNNLELLIVLQIWLASTYILNVENCFLSIFIEHYKLPFVNQTVFIKILYERELSCPNFGNECWKRITDK